AEQFPNSLDVSRPADARDRRQLIGADRQLLALQPFRPQNLGCLLNGCNDLCPGRASVSRTPRNVTLAGTRFCFPLRPLHILAPLCLLFELTAEFGLERF